VVQELPAGEFDVRDGAFDVAIVPDLLVAQAPAEFLARLRRLLSKGGSALIGTRAESESPEAVEYYELYDRVALQFSHVRMIAEVPFAGVALADLSLEGDAPEVTVETQLEGDPSPPERFFALASQDDVRLSEYAIVQLPLTTRGSRGQAGPRSDAGNVARAALAQAQLRATLLETQIDELKAKGLRQAEGVLSAHRGAELQAELAEESARRRDADARAAEHYLRAERLSNEAREASAELTRERDRAALLEVALAGAEATILALETRVAEGEERLALRKDELARIDASEARTAALATELSLASEGHAAELAALEGALRERARVVRDLEEEVTRREHLVRELVASLEESLQETRAASETGAIPQTSAGDVEVVNTDLAAVRRDLESRDVALRAADERAATLEAVNDDLRARLDALSADVARRESERQEVIWRIGELEQQISLLEAEQTELTETLPPPPMGRSRVGTVLEAQDAVHAQKTELDVLRQAMAQEHEARVRAESGEELSNARAELARQALLLEQLSRELEARDRSRGSDPRDHASTEA
jgi:chromosome segregation ATPase